MKSFVLIGGIASGKSTVGRELERLGAARIDLDQLSRDVCAPGSPVLLQIAERFGDDLIDGETGALDRALLASRAFSSPESAADLEAITHPAITERLMQELQELAGAPDAPVACIVEIPLPDRVPDVLAQADDVLLVSCPVGERRRRAQLRGVDPKDFDLRVKNQPTDGELLSMATVVFANDGDEAELLARVRSWWETIRVADTA